MATIFRCRGEGFPSKSPGQVLAIVNVDLSKMEIEPARRKAVRLNVSIPGSRST